jgi:hypothetical protein
MVEFETGSLILRHLEVLQKMSGGRKEKNVHNNIGKRKENQEESDQGSSEVSGA